MHTYMRDAYIYAAGPNPRHYTYRSHLPCEFSQVSGHVGGPITSRLLAVPGTRPPAISTRKRAFDSCSTSFLVAVLILAKRGSLYCGFCPPPLCLFNKLERPNEMMKIALIFRTTAGSSSYSSAGGDSCCPLDSSSRVSRPLGKGVKDVEQIRSDLGVK